MGSFTWQIVRRHLVENDQRVNADAKRYCAEDHYVNVSVFKRKLREVVNI